MRIFQIAHLHPDYENLLMVRNAGKRTYAECVQSYLDDGYWGGHTLTPALERQGHETFLCVCDEYSQRIWCEENGIEWQNAYITCLYQIALFQPDVLYIGSVLHFYDDFLEALPWRPKLIVGWHATHPWPYLNMRHYDLVLSSHGECLNFAREKGAAHTAYAYPGIGAAAAKNALAQEPQTDIAFAGGYWSCSHPRRNRFLIDLAKRAELLGLRCTYNLGLNDGSPPCPSVVLRRNCGAVWGQAMLDAFAASRIALNAFCTIDSGPQNLSPNLRQLEIMGVGSLLLTEQSPNIEAFFTEGADLVTFANVDELVDKARYYLAHEDKRRAIAAHGQHTCRTRYSMDIRARAFMDKIEQLLAKTAPVESVIRMLHALAAARSTTPDAACTADAHTILQQALHQLPALLQNHAPEGTALLFALEALTLGDIKNINYCRALHLMQEGDTANAQQRLRQELHDWPENDAARSLLSTIYLQNNTKK